MLVFLVGMSTKVLTLKALIIKPFPLMRVFEFNRSARLFNFSLTLFSPKSKSPTSLRDKILTYKNTKEESITLFATYPLLQVGVIVAKYFLSFKLKYPHQSAIPEAIRFKIFKVSKFDYLKYFDILEIYYKLMELLCLVYKHKIHI